MTRKEEIIFSTLELASTYGLRAISLSQIAERVGIKKPSLYNHFKSKDEIVSAMYSFLRERANSGNSAPSGFEDMFSSQSLEEILLGSVTAYLGIVSDKHMLQFFKVLYSERSTNPIAAQIMLEETDRMLQSSRNMFYALVVHGKVRNESIDVAAMTYSLTIHSLIDYRMDMLTAGKIQEFGENGSPIPKNIENFIRWFSRQIGVKDEQKID